jgi:hypothetical protein
MHKRLSVFLVALVFFVAALPASRALAETFSIGGLAGVAFPSETGASSRFGWGFEGDYKLLPNITGGIYFLSSGQSIATPAIGATPASSVEQHIQLYGVQAAFHLSDLALGARLGVGHDSTDVPSGSVTNTAFSIGPYVAYDYHLSSMFSVGGDASLLFVTTSSSYNVVNVLATVKVWL